MGQEIEITMDIEIPVKVKVYATPGRPAKLWGPMDECYPEDPPEAEITGWDEVAVLKDMQSYLDNIQEDELLEYCEEAKGE